MVLIRSNLHDLVVALDLARLVFSRIKLNFVWAMIYNLLAVPYAAGIWFPWTHLVLPPQYAGLSMAASSVSVVVSSMALWLYKRPAILSDDPAMRQGGVLQRAKRYKYDTPLFFTLCNHICEEYCLLMRVGKCTLLCFAAV